MAGANAMTMPNRPMAEPRRSGGKVSMSTVMTMGIKNARAGCLQQTASEQHGEIGTPTREAPNRR